MNYFFEFLEMWIPWWNDIDRGKLKDLEKILSQCHFVHHKSHWIDPGCHGERPATNCLSHGMAPTMKILRNKVQVFGYSEFHYIENLLYI
jgi:hypothetical protein